MVDEMFSTEFIQMKITYSKITSWDLCLLIESGNAKLSITDEWYENLNNVYQILDIL